ncbi:MAG: glutamate-1-semialdehyde 2,1-aminomutase [Paraglaciecola sp.]|jgi:glutamate-1-semialdehyde 2,1-aminomutase
MSVNISKELFERAKKSIPGGVNSPVRAFKAVGGDPLFFTSAKGAYMTDEDGNSYIDLINSWGPMILGHAYEKVEKAIVDSVKFSSSFGAPGRREVEIAELIASMVPSIEKVRMVNSGTEATMSAIRLARGYTGRNKFIKFTGNYHGHGDSFLIAAGSGAATMGTPDSPGVTPGTAQDTLLADFNDIESVKRVTSAHPGQIAAIMLEPVAGNMGCVPPAEGFLQALRHLCDQEGIVLIFDEVMTGFRLAKGGAQEYYGVTPDMTTLGKIIGGGMPVGAYGGKAELMDFVSPEGPVYQAGTLAGNPVAMAAGIAMLTTLNEDSSIYTQLEQNTSAIVAGYRSTLSKLGLDLQINQVGSMFTLFFTSKHVTNFESACTTDLPMFGKYFRSMLSKGIYLAPSQYESLFVSTAIQSEQQQAIITANEESLKEIFSL